MKLLLASAHRYADLARLWYRFVARHLAPVLRAAGADVEILVFRDAHPESFDPKDFPGATLLAAGPFARDFLEFYDAALLRESDILFLLDADLFVLDGSWVASFLARFEDPSVAAVSLLRRTEQPGVYALLARTSAYRALDAPAFAPSYEGLGTPAAVNRQPGDRAAIALRARGLTILDVPASAAAGRLADFHGTTVIRASREVFGPALGPRFDRLLSEKPYFAMGAYDNLLLGTLFHAVFGAPFAPGEDGTPLAGSATLETLREALKRVRDRTALARFLAYAARSNRAASGLFRREGVPFSPPRLLPLARALEARAWGLARFLARRTA
ncbi:MAG TPA: hypothetical protein VKS23_09070 [Thermoanaerobaculia bacterium]|nr:hypothetical protein [Thermoanaerobaculia bacterium]